MDSDRLAGILMCVGGISGLAGMALGLAAVGGGISALYLFGALLFQSRLGTIQGSVAVLAGMVALAGAAIKRIPTTRQTSAFP